MFKRWNARIKNCLRNEPLNWSISLDYPSGAVTKVEMGTVIQILTSHSLLCEIQYIIGGFGGCFSPICTCLLEEESPGPFLYVCLFNKNRIGAKTQKLRNSPVIKRMVHMETNDRFHFTKSTNQLIRNQTHRL